MIIITNRDLFEAVHEIYGHSNEWLTGLAKELKVSYNTAEHLAAEAGYYRHKIIKNVSLDEFTWLPYTQFVIKKKGLVII